MGQISSAHQQQQEITSKIIVEEKSCLDPATVIDKDESILTEMMRSHHWLVEEGKAYGIGSVIIRFKYSKCNAIGHAVIARE
ncbi:MAG: hypothetical protein ACRDF4_09425 [Rhabdochlamydiaceae bacterium]